MPDGNHRRDFVFNAGFYDSTDMTPPGAGTDRFVVSASNNALRANSFPQNPGRDPIAISASGWYTFEHRFYDSGAGVLTVDLSIYDAGGVLVHTWTLSDPTDIIGATVGGNRYGWFANQEFAVFAYDDSLMIGCPGACCDNGAGTQSDCIADTNAFDCEADGGLFLGDGTECTPDIECEALAVTLDSFSARPVPEGVLLNWTTALEIDTVGFRVLRETTDSREKSFTVVRELVYAIGYGFAGASYEVLDTRAARLPHGHVRYWLEDIEYDGKVTRHGPFELEQGRRDDRPAGRTR